MTWPEGANPEIYALVIDPTNTAIVYAGGSSGLYKSTDAGANWSKVQIASNI